MMLALQAVGVVDKVKKSVPTSQEQCGVLVNRIKTCPTLSDKRTAVDELRQMPARDLREMGAAHFTNLLHCLRANRHDPMISEGTLSVVSDVIDTKAPVGPSPKEEPSTPGSASPRVASDTPTDPSANTADKSVHRGMNATSITEMYLATFADKERELKGIDTLLGVLREHGFHSKLSVLQFLALVVQYHPEVVQSFSAMNDGIHYLVKLLHCSPEDFNGQILKNETLPLLKSIAVSDHDVQKVLVYEGAFESILAIIKDEGGIDGGVVVEDCLEMLHHLLATNASNQKSFRDFTGLGTLTPLLTFDKLSDSGCRVVVLTIYLVSYFLKGAGTSPEELSKTVNCIAGITVKGGVETLSAAPSLLTGLAAVSIHPTPKVEAHVEAIKCLTMLVKASDKIKEQLLGLMIERGSDVFKWLNCVADFVAQEGEDKETRARQGAAAEVIDALTESEAMQAQVAAGFVGEACDVHQPHPAKALMRALFAGANACYYSSYLISRLLASCPQARVTLTLFSTHEGQPLFQNLLTSLKALIRAGSKLALPRVHSIFRLFLTCIPGNPHLAILLTRDLSDVSFFVETANADGIEPLSVQVLSCILLGVAKITAADSLRDENGGGDAQQLGAALKALRDALIRRIGVDRLSHRYGELKKDQQFLSASTMFHKTNPQDWDTHLVQCLDTAYEAIQNSVLQDVMDVPAETRTNGFHAPVAQEASNALGNAGHSASGDSVDHAGGANEQALRQIITQQQSDLDVARTENQRLRDQLKVTQDSPLLAEAAASSRREALEREEDLTDQVQTLQNKVKLLESQLQDFEEQQSEDKKLAAIAKEVAEAAMESLLVDKRTLEDEHQSLVNTLTAVEERLDRSDSKLALLNQLAMDDDALREQLSRSGALRYIEGTYLPVDANTVTHGVADAPASTTDAVSAEEYAAVLQRESQLNDKLNHLAVDQCDLYALLGEYDERLQKIMRTGVGASTGSKQAGTVTHVNNNHF